MSDCYLQLGNTRIPIAHRNLRVLADCIEDAVDFPAIDPIATEIRKYLDAPPEPVVQRPIPTDETLDKLLRLGTDITNHPVLDDKDGQIAAGLLEIGSELVELGTQWPTHTDNPNYGYHTLVRHRPTLLHWVDELHSINGRGSFEVAGFRRRLFAIMRNETTEGAF